MDTETLKTFLLLANTKNFSRTAEIMFVSQSAVTARIKSIEEELNKTLFVRNKTSVELTPHGKIFIHYAKSICNLDLESKKALDVSGRFTSRLSIAAPETIWQSTVFSKFRTLIEKYPNISYNVNVLHSNDIVDGILDDNIDIGFVLNRPTHRMIETVELWNCGYVLVKSPALKLNSRYFSPDTLDDSLHRYGLGDGIFELAQYVFLSTNLSVSHDSRVSVHESASGRPRRLFPT